jgi:3-oxoacyl-[acyl-carrier-protein] synthase II
MGTINPIGKSVGEFWKNLNSGIIGTAPITLFDSSQYATKIAAEVKDFEASQFMDNKDARKMARFCQFAVAGANEALKDSGLLDYTELNKERVAVILGNGIGGFEITEDSHTLLLERGPKGIPPLTIPKLIINEGPAHISIINGFLGPCYAVVTACSSGTDALGNALNSIRAGICDVAVSGGMEAAITPFSIGSFNKLLALSTRNDDPKTASRPFDKDRDGFVMGEGSGILILEELEHAKRRGAKIYAELAGYGQTCDAFHITAPDETSEGGARCMRLAIQDAGLKPEDIDYINAHGTSTPVNDPVETNAIKKALGEHAYKVRISSTKAQTAHMVGGAGGVEAIVSILAITEQFMPGTMNLFNPDEKCDLNYLPNKGEKGIVKAAFSNNLGFGGHNGTVVFKKYE